MRLKSLGCLARAAAEPGLPAVRKAPPVGVRSVAKARTWFWIEPSWWITYTEAAQSPTGRMTVTVTADPQDVVFETGEGTIDTSCGIGFAIDEYSDPDDPTACSWEYFHSTVVVPGGFYRAEATTTFAMNWNMTFNTGAVFDQGTLPDYTSTDGFDIEVTELLAVGRSMIDTDAGFP